MARTTQRPPKGSPGRGSSTNLDCACGQCPCSWYAPTTARVTPLPAECAASALIGAACYASTPLAPQTSYPWAEETVGTFVFAIAFVSAYLAFSAPQKPATASDADWACLVPDEFEEATDALCGALSFDSTDDGPMCIEIMNADGELRWACSH